MFHKKKRERPDTCERNVNGVSEQSVSFRILNAWRNFLSVLSVRRVIGRNQTWRVIDDANFVVTFRVRFEIKKWSNR